MIFSSQWDQGIPKKNSLDRNEILNCCPHKIGGTQNTESRWNPGIGTIKLFCSFHFINGEVFHRHLARDNVTNMIILNRRFMGTIYLTFSTANLISFFVFLKRSCSCTASCRKEKSLRTLVGKYIFRNIPQFNFFLFNHYAENAIIYLTN